MACNIVHTKCSIVLKSVLTKLFVVKSSFLKIQLNEAHKPTVL